jgi:hypothetical protein
MARQFPPVYQIYINPQTIQECPRANAVTTADIIKRATVVSLTPRSEPTTGAPNINHRRINMGYEPMNPGKMPKPIKPPKRK